jgi:hypothetical protein
MNSPLNLKDSTGLGPPEKNQSQDPSNVGTPNPNATWHPSTQDFKDALVAQAEIDRIDAQLALLSSKRGNVPDGYNQKLGVDITDPNIRLAYELGMGGSPSLLELEDPTYKIQRLQEEKQIYEDFLKQYPPNFLKQYTPTKRQQVRLPMTIVTSWWEN